MSTQLSIHGVARVEVSAYSAPVDGIVCHRMHCQRIKLFGSDNRELGEVVLFLEDPKAALAVGDCTKLDSLPVAETECWSEEARPF
jgi:hypothetical protein